MHATLFLLATLPGASPHDHNARAALALAQAPVARPAQAPALCPCGPSCACPAGVCPACPTRVVLPPIRRSYFPTYMAPPVYFQSCPGGICR